MAVKTLLDPLTKGQVPQTVGTIPKRHKYSWAYKDEEDNYFIGTPRTLDIPEHPTDVLHTLSAGEVARPDMLSYKYYGTPDLYWAILWINGILDPFEGMYAGMLLRIPTLQRLVSYGVT